ncbi:MAG: type II secretion system GspH family protein [Bifidobacteriaceae bacterium]|jgi:prepilin-type N-terminal cleavage/methylation domain-containing protein|nr:type II secretion system GspH family protein [Bifidobacteriaceae bacterium]
MARRIWRGEPNRDRGFSLVELLIVVIVLGVLACIAVPIFLSQRAKAEDAQTQNDVVVMGRELSAYWTEYASAPTILLVDSFKPGERTWHLLPPGVSSVTAGNFYDTLVAGVSEHVAVNNSGASDQTLWAAKLISKSDWCFWAYNPRGKQGGFWVTSATSAAGAEGSSANKCA